MLSILKKMNKDDISYLNQSDNILGLKLMIILKHGKDLVVGWCVGTGRS